MKIFLTPPGCFRNPIGSKLQHTHIPGAANSWLWLQSGLWFWSYSRCPCCTLWTAPYAAMGGLGVEGSQQTIVSALIDFKVHLLTYKYQGRFERPFNYSRKTLSIRLDPTSMQKYGKSSLRRGEDATLDRLVLTLTILGMNYYLVDSPTASPRRTVILTDWTFSNELESIRRGCSAHLGQDVSLWRWQLHYGTGSLPRSPLYCIYFSPTIVLFNW
jgi:hypothetical protein